MAGSLAKRRKTNDHFKDLVEHLDLGLSDEKQQSLVGDLMSSSKKDLGDVLSQFVSANQLSQSAVFSKLLQFRDKDEDKEDAEYSSARPKEYKLIKQYHASGNKLPPSAVTWNVLLHVGIVSLTAQGFLDVAKGKKQSSLLCQFDSGPLNSALVASVTFSCYNEAILSHITGDVIAHFALLLRSKFQGKFSYEIQSSLDDQWGFPDALIVYHDSKDKKERKVVVVMEIKTKVPLGLNVFDEADKKNLAQLVYTGHTYSGTQDFMPLLVLTNCAIWHFFELDDEACPQRYCDVAVNPPDGLPITKSTKFDAVGVFSEIVGFIQRNEKHFN